MKLASFQANLTIEEVGQISENNNYRYLEIKARIENSTQILDFYLSDNKTNARFKDFVRKHFSDHNSLRKGDTFLASFNIVENKQGSLKLKIWEMYNVIRNK